MCAMKYFYIITHAFLLFYRKNINFKHHAYDPDPDPRKG